MNNIEAAKKYLGKTFVGFTIPGQCVALFNQVNLDALGVKYPIQGASTAYQILTATNTRPDLVEQVKNDPKNPNQLPSVGDWVIWNTKLGNGAGHISCVESVSSVGFTGIEQNFIPNKVTRQNHNFTNVIGWIHYKTNQQGDEMLTRQKVIDTYLVIRGSAPSEAEIAAHLNGGTMESLVKGFKGEADGNRANVQKALSDLQTALQNEKNKPPVEVIKTVEKIVEKVVEKQVIVEVEPSYIKKIRDFILGFLNKKG